MRNSLRTYFVGLLVAIMTINPAVANRYCGGGYQRYSGPVYYSGCCGGWNNCCGYEVVVDDCGACHPCGDCNPCGTVVKESAPAEPMHEPTPAQPMNVEPAIPAQPQQPAQVERPVDIAPAPALPPQPAPTPPQVPLPNDEFTPPTPPSDNLFDSPPAPAAEPPAAAPPAATDDLFGTPVVKPAAPADPPAEAPATPPAADPATPPAATDDLFGTPATPAETPPAPAPAEKPADAPAAEEKKEEKKADDIFGAAPGMLREAGGLASDEMRVWVDNTGSFSCRARLVRFLDGQVRLLKDNGRTTTVTLSRLSADDLRFVERQASAQQASVFQTAQSMSVMPWLAN